MKFPVEMTRRWRDGKRRNAGSQASEGLRRRPLSCLHFALGSGPPWGLSGEPPDMGEAKSFGKKVF